MSEKTFILTVDFFKTDILVHFGNNKSCMDALDKYNFSSEEKIDIMEGLYGKECNGMVWSKEQGKVLLYLGFKPVKKLSNKNLGILMHECLHVAYRLLEFCGIQTETNEELLCMTQQMVFNSIMNEL